jgi:hypothetical protein
MGRGKRIWDACRKSLDYHERIAGRNVGGK